MDELAYLAIECARLGAPWIGDVVLGTYNATEDAAPARLVDFYATFRATLRAKLAIWHLDDDGAENPKKWIGRATDYLRVAGRCTRRLR